jgi:hypothetical protein
MKRIPIFLVVGLLLASCTPNGPRFEENMIRPPGKSSSQLVFYFPSEMSGFAAMTLRVEDRACKLYENGFMIVRVKPGEIEVELGGEKEDIPAEAGKTAFVKIYPNQAKKTAEDMGGLAGLLAYTAMKHGTKANADFYFDLVEDEIATEEIETGKMELSPGCPKK